VATNLNFELVRDILDRNGATFGQSAKKILIHISKGTGYTSIRDAQERQDTSKNIIIVSKSKELLLVKIVQVHDIMFIIFLIIIINNNV